jgi:hypothetical protein
MAPRAVLIPTDHKSTRPARSDVLELARVRAMAAVEITRYTFSLRKFVDRDAVFSPDHPPFSIRFTSIQSDGTVSGIIARTPKSKAWVGVGSETPLPEAVAAHLWTL